jgi:hypothetical protein
MGDVVVLNGGGGGCPFRGEAFFFCSPASLVVHLNRIWKLLIFDYFTAMHDYLSGNYPLQVNYQRFFERFDFVSKKIYCLLRFTKPDIEESMLKDINSWNWILFGEGLICNMSSWCRRIRS